MDGEEVDVLDEEMDSEEGGKLVCEEELGKGLNVKDESGKGMVKT